MAVKSASVGQSEAFPGKEPSLFPSLSFFLSSGVWRFFLCHVVQIGRKSSQKHPEATQKASVWPLGKPGVNWRHGGKRLTFLEAVQAIIN